MLQADYHKRPRACDVLSCLRKRRVEFDCPEDINREINSSVVPNIVNSIQEGRSGDNPSSSTLYDTTNADSQATILIGSSSGYEFLNETSQSEFFATLPIPSVNDDDT